MLTTFSGTVGGQVRQVLLYLRPRGFLNRAQFNKHFTPYTRNARFVCAAHTFSGSLQLGVPFLRKQRGPKLNPTNPLHSVPS